MSVYENSKTYYLFTKALCLIMHMENMSEKCNEPW